jgi:hypothetical protein
MKQLRIEPVYSGDQTAVSQYRVVDYFNGVLFIGTYIECYNYLYPCILYGVYTITEYV